MRRIIGLVFVLAASSVLSGCFSLGRTASAEKSPGNSRTVKLPNSGSMEVALDSFRLSPEQRDALRQLQSVAIWPDAGGLAAVLSDTVSQGSTLEVVPPSRVSESLKKLGIKGDIAQFPREERLRLFQRVSQDTGAEAVLSVAAAGQKVIPFSAANPTQGFTVTVYARDGGRFIAEMPATVKVNFAGTPTRQSIDASQVLGAEFGKIIIALTDNLERGIVVANTRAVAQPVAVAFVPEPEPAQVMPTRPATPARQQQARSLSPREVQIRLQKKGFDTGGVDGKLGPRSIAAIKKFQKSQGLEVTGRLDAETMKNLQEGEQDLRAAR